MKLNRVFLNSILLVFFALIFLKCKNEPGMKDAPAESLMYSKMDIVQPTCEKKPKELSIHGDTRIDNYYWLNDRENPDVIAYLNAENKYLDTVMSHLDSFKTTLFDEIVARIKQDDESVPYLDNGYWYYTRYEKGKEYPIYCRKEGNMDAAEQIMLDVNELAKPYSFYNVGGLSVSPDNKILAFGEDTLSRRIYTIRFKNLETGEISEQKIENTTGSTVWANDNNTFFFTRKDETLRPDKIYKRKFNQAGAADQLVWHESDPTFVTYVYNSRSKKYIFIGSYQTVSTEYKVISADQPDAPYKVFQPRERDLEYAVEHFNDKFYIRTNFDAKNFRLMECGENATSKNDWQELIPHRDSVLFEGMDFFNNYLVLSERIDGILKMRIRGWDGSDDHYVDFGEEAYVASAATNREADTKKVRIGYTSMTTPVSVLEYDMETHDLKVLKEQEVIGDFDKNNYQSERLYVKARDGVKVPVSLVYRKDLFKKDGSSPLLLYGYGSYGASMDPYFSSVRLSLLDRGFVYAIAHIRGGEELGRQWYEDGKLLNKKNTFTDFIDCGKYLVAEKYGAADELYGMGGSAGGLLMGAVVNMEPKMWKGIIAAVPFVDVVTTMLDESIPLTTGEFDEWGNPKDKTYYDYIKSYSPYDNVEAKEYPAMMVTTGLHDSQVQYWEPAKWVAKLRDMKTDKNPLVMYCNMDTGHSGASGRFERYKETAMEYAWLLDLAGKAD
ncbi:MAG: S9 family peptidase [Saprospiraceae bacterium]